MRIHRSILDYDMFRHPYTEGGKIPKSLDSSLDNPVCHLLRFLHRHGDHPDRRAIFFLLGRKIIHVVDRYPVNPATISKPYWLSPVSCNKEAPRLPTPNRNALCWDVKPRKSSNTSTNALISYPTLVFPEIFTKERSLAT